MTIGSDVLITTQAFTGADGTALPAPFVARRGTWNIYSNACGHALGEGLGTNSATANPSRANDNYLFQADLNSDPSTVAVKGLLVRRSNGTTTTNNGYVLGCDDSGNAAIWSLTNDSLTLLSSAFVGIGGLATTYKAYVDGSSLTLKNAAGTTLVSATDATYATGDVGFFDSGNSVTSLWDNAYLQGTASSGSLIVLGSQVHRMRPMGRGPHKGPFAPRFRPNRGSNAMRQVLLQVFSSPGVPLANTALNFWTAYNEAGIAIDGVAPTITLTTDANGFVLLQNLKISAGTGQVRCAYPGDVSKSRNFTVTFY